MKDYQAPTEEQAAKVKKATALPPICNYPGEGFREMTEAEWKARRKCSDFPYIGEIGAHDTIGRHRVRQMPTPGSMWKKQQVVLTDAKRVDPPKLEPKPEETAPAMETPEPVESEATAPAVPLPVSTMQAAWTDPARPWRSGNSCEEIARMVRVYNYTPEAAAYELATRRLALEHQPAEKPAEPVGVESMACAVAPVMIAESYQAPPKPANDPYQVMRDQLRAGGVKVTVAAQLFPTPRELAFRVVEEAQLRPGDRILEPSAGTGRLIDAAALSDWEWSGEVVAVETNPALASALLAKYGKPVQVRHADFLECGAELGAFDRVIMNPPFIDQSDVRHVMHAARFLKPGGRLVAIMAAGVTFRQDRMSTEFRAFVERRGGTIEALPAESFKESGTNVNAVLVVFDGE